MLPILAIAISVASLLVTVWLWRESNRPVVSVQVRTHSAGNVAILYNVEVTNSGSRPAKNVRLRIAQDELMAAIVPEARGRHDFDRQLAYIERCFDERAAIPVLLNGASISNAFGQTGSESPFWRPGAVMQLSLSYQGLQGQRYKTRMPLRIDNTEGFAGTSYSSSSDT